jgi:aryl-alcohol dehydrogenase-like predicted oxidoreductase
MVELIEGFADEPGTRRFAERSRGRAAEGHYRQFAGLALSSVGIGTYLGKDDAATDTLYEEAIATALEHDINVIDTAINYRSQRSERSIGRVLALAIESDQWLARNEVLVASKAGFLPFDDGRPSNARAHFEAEYVRRGIFRWEEVVGGCHCMTPRYLRDQIDRSRKNLGLATIDVYYLHNPETQLDEVPRPEFLRRMRAAFEALEGAVQEKKIRWYGTATWNGYRVPPDDPGHLSLEALLGEAEAVAGKAHHFRFVQLPFNSALREAAARENQTRGGLPMSLFEAAKGEVYVMTSASIMQGKLTEPKTRSIQFVRSTDGVGTALVGMKNAEHVLENAAVAKEKVGA